MYFCPNCNNVFDITKGTSQAGGDITNTSENMSPNIIEKDFIGGFSDDNYEKLISKILKNEKIDENEIKKISADDLTKSLAYKKLKNKQREEIYNKVQDLLPNEQKKIIKGEEPTHQIEKAYFICNNCGNRQHIDEGTLIFRRISNDLAQSYSSSDVKDMKYSDILPFTRKYKCPNIKCDTHKYPEKKEAIFFRMNNTFGIKHICKVCDTVF